MEDERVLAAAILHDVIEDTPMNRRDIAEHFGEEIASWVHLLSRDESNEIEEKEEQYLEQLKNAPVEVKLIKISDIYDNLMDSQNCGNKIQVIRTTRKSIKYIEYLREGDLDLKNAIGIVEMLIRELRE